MDKNDILEFAKMIKGSEHTVFFGGAGVSTESGLKDYRSEDGIYHTAVNYGMSPEEILSHNCFFENTDLFYRFFRDFFMESAEPNITQQNSAMDMLRKKNTRTLSELEQIPYQPQVYAIPIEQRKRESKLLADAVEFQPKLYQMIERLATAEELSDHCTRIQNIEAEYMEKTVREVVTENRKTAAQMQNLVEQAGKNQEQFILNCSETISKSTETLDSTIEKLRRKILKIMIATAVSAVALSLLVCAVFWKLAV